ncbi:MAG: zinc ribbon domain-containing protein [Terracidiphilus sp.]|jgi:hypothetical protein
MFCSGCGATVEAGQTTCPKCNRLVAPAVPVPPPVPNFEFEVANHAGKIRVLGILWLVYAGLSMIAGFAGLAFLHSFMSGGFAPWMHGSHPPMWFFPALVHFAWVMVLAHSILAAVAGWGLLERTQWGRIVAIVSAILNFFHFFPFGLAMGIATLVLLIGGRNWVLYEQL